MAKHKRGTKEPDSLIEHFEWSYPLLYKKMESWIEIDKHEIRVTTTDGKTFLYLSGEHFPHEIKLFNDPIELTDEEWIRGFSYKLQKQLRLNNMTQYMLSKRLGISTRTVTRYLTFETIPPSSTLHKIASILNCSTDDLMPKEYIRLD